MRWRSETYREKCDRRSKWHRWFAWRPVRKVDKEMVWLENIARRIDGDDTYYGDLMDILKSDAVETQKF